MACNGGGGDLLFHVPKLGVLFDLLQIVPDLGMYEIVRPSRLQVQRRRLFFTGLPGLRED